MLTLGKPEQGAVGAFFAIFRGGLIAPNGLTRDSIRLLLNAEPGEEQDSLTRQWRDHKLQELNFVGVVGALLTGCLTGTGSWPSILQNGQSQPWPVRLCWFAGIVFGLFSVLTAAQQSLRLHRLSSHKEALANIRKFMAKRKIISEEGTEIEPRRFQVYGWQTSIMFLTLSVAAMIVGMAILVWYELTLGLQDLR